MANQSSPTQPADEGQARPVSPAFVRHRAKWALVLTSAAFSLAAFGALDWFHSAAIQRGHPPEPPQASCWTYDPVRHHALKPNCASVERWGTDSYEFFTNNLGFRDEKVRAVPLTDERPRILILGNSFTEGKVAWRDSYVGRIAAQFPQYDFLNGAMGGYSPSNYLNVTRMGLARGLNIDEVMVFTGGDDVLEEAAYYRDVDASGAVTGPQRKQWNNSWYSLLRTGIARHLMFTNDVLEFLERKLVRSGYYHLPSGQMGKQLDQQGSAWSYRKVDETRPYPAGYAPLGVEGGIAKEQAKMTLLWQELKERNIPMSVVVIPGASQIAFDMVDSREVRIWRDWCEGRCKRFISVFPAFFEAKDQCPRLRPGCWYLNYFIFGDDHYNAAGNALVADVVIKNLIEDPPVKRQSPMPSREQASNRIAR